MPNNNAVLILIAVINQAPAILAFLLSGLTALLTYRHGRCLTKNSEDIRELAQNTNSIKDDLVKITGEKEFARGHKQGSDETEERLK